MVDNILRGNLKITPRTRQFLSKYKKELRQLADFSRGLDRKRKILQKGSGAFVVPIVASLLTSIIGKLIENNV